MGGRPGEKMRSEILSDLRIIIATRFWKGTRGAAADTLVLEPYSLEITSQQAAATRAEAGIVRTQAKTID